MRLPKKEAAKKVHGVCCGLCRNKNGTPSMPDEFPWWIHPQCEKQCATASRPWPYGPARAVAREALEQKRQYRSNNGKRCFQRVARLPYNSNIALDSFSRINRTEALPVHKWCMLGLAWAIRTSLSICGETAYCTEGCLQCLVFIPCIHFVPGRLMCGDAV